MNANIPQMNVVATDVRPPERKGPKVFHEDAGISTVNVPPRVRGEGGVSRNKINSGATTTSVRAHINSVALAVFLMVALAMTMMFAMPNSVRADEPVDGVGTSLLTDEVISPLAAGEVGTTFADAETRGDWSWSLGDPSSTRYNGRVWTDKSVSTTDVTFSGNVGTVTVPIGDGENASDFLVTYSLLATSQQVTGKSSVPVDVVFVVDLSGSMSNSDSIMDNDLKRIQNLVTALNASINELMDMNPENRIGVVGYSTTATTILPLDRYTPSGNNLNIFSYSNQNTRLSWDALNSSNQRVNNSIEVSGGTNIQMGIYQGMNMLASEEETSTTVDGQEMQRVPSVIVMADGAATYSSSSVQWWNPSNNGNDGPGSRSYYGNGMKAMMVASYMKQAIDRNYQVENAGSNYATRVYTIGIGTSDLGGDDEDLANITLNPKEHWNDNNDMANSIRNAWNGGSFSEGYISDNGTGTPVINVGGVSGRYYYDDWYELTHPQDYDIVDIGLQYNDAYYNAITADDINTIFKDIVSSISLNTPQAPTKVEGGDPVQGGYVTYTDVIGDYMEVDSVKCLIWADSTFSNPEQGVDENGNVTYTFTGKINNPAYENVQNANQIQIIVHTSTADDGMQTQTLTVKVPASAIPLRVNTIELSENNQGETIVDRNTSNNVYPLRLVYGVSLQEGINPETLEGVSDEYIKDNTDENGKVSFYSNKFSNQEIGGTTVGDATVEFTPADNNPFYFLQEDTPIYLSQTGDERVSQFDSSSNYWVPITYYNGTQIVNTRVERSGSTMVNWVEQDENGYFYIKASAPRLGDIAQFIRLKGENFTSTAAASSYPTFVGEDVHNGQFVVYLGNNGELQLDAPASLVIGKNVTAEEGLTAPETTFTFEITSVDKADKTVDAVKTTGTGDEATTEDTTVEFDENGVATVQLNANQTIELKGMAGADYSVKEINVPNGFTLTSVTGADETEGTGNDTIASGEIAAGSEDETVTFVNNYSVIPVSSDDLNIPLGGTKTIDGRSFQAGDEFTFTIAAAQATPDAPLPQKDGKDVTSAIIAPSSGNESGFSFDGVITFTKPGEYRYIIREIEGELAGVDYDTAVFRLNIVVVDNGDGTLRLATVNGDVNEIEGLTEEDGMAGDGLVYTANPMVQEYDGAMHGADGNAVKFENGYDANAATATIQGTKILNVTNSDYKLADGDFIFTIRALGSTQEAKESYEIADFAPDGNQPMPVDGQGQPVTQTTNIANGDVQFGFAQGAFTQAMVGTTYGYEITESLGSAPDNTVMDENATRIVWITVGDDGQGQVTATVAPNDGGSGEHNNFTFTNSYKPSGVTIGGDSGKAGIAVQKTFVNHAWTSDYNFTYTIACTSAPNGVAAPMPSPAEVTVSNPASGDVNTGVFGAMTFEQEGTYIYEITETNGGRGGIEYDEHKATVTVEVTEDEATGTLSANVSYDNGNASTDADKNVKDAAAFTNVYDATFDEGTAVNLDGTKNLTVRGNSDRTLSAGMFFFSVTPLDGAPYGDNVIDSGAGSYSIGNGVGDESENGVFSGPITGLLKNVTYRLSDLGGASSKDFVYLIAEQQGNATGTTYDHSVYQVTVTVTDDGNGKLSAGQPQIVKGTMQEGAFVADVDQSGVNGVVFNNSYTPTEVVLGDDEDQLQVTKSVAGANALGEFEFTLQLTSANRDGVKQGGGEDAVPFPEEGIRLSTKALSGTQGKEVVEFGTLTFTAVGDYTFTVTENTETSAGGWNYDNAPKTITVEVLERNGALVVGQVTGNNPTVANVYRTTPAELVKDTESGIGVQKVVSGAPNAEDFIFGAVFNANAEGNTGSIDNIEGLTDGKLTATIAEDFDNGQTRAADFGTVKFTAPGVYIFDVTEDNTAAAGSGWTYDGSTHQIKVTVTDNGQGALVASVEGNDPTFYNTYTASPKSYDEQGDLNITKTLAGRDMDAGEFQVEISGNIDAMVRAGLAEHSGLDKISVVIAFPAAAENKDAVINPLAGVTFTKADADAGTQFVYTIRELVPVEGQPGYNKAMTYDGTVYTVTLWATDNYDGTLTIHTSIATNDGEAVEWDYAANGNPTVEFHNVYKGPTEPGTLKGATDLLVSKTIENRGWYTGESYSFMLEAVDSNPEVDAIPMPDGAVEGKAIVVLSGDMATSNFGDIKFDRAGTYTYRISEVAGSDSSMTYDLSVYTVTVTVDETIDGTLLVSSTMEKTADAEGAELEVPEAVEGKTAAFTNTFDPETVRGTYPLKGTKYFSGREFSEGDSFTFTVEPVDGAPAPKDGDDKTVGQVTINPTEGEEATVDFGIISFTQTGEYSYTVSEVEGTNPAVNYDTDPKTVTLYVTDNDNNGEFEVTPVFSTGDALVWTNSVKAPTATDPLAAVQATKNLSGDQLADGQFTFLVQAQGNAPMGNSLPAVFNGAGSEPDENGVSSSTFDVLSGVVYDTEGVYTYLVSEVDDGQVGVTYDEAVYQITVTVTVGEGNKLVATPTIQRGTVDAEGVFTSEGDADLIVFNNTFTATPTSVAPQVTKVIDGNGHALVEGEFAFDMTVTDLEGNQTTASTTNAADGTVAFGDVEFDSEGTYTIAISEQLPDGVTADNPVVDGMTYDTHTVVYTYDVNRDLSTNSLVWTLAHIDGDETFTNVYDSTTGGEGSVEIAGTKTITGRDMAEDDVFTFVLTDAAGNVVATATNAGADFSFKLSYTNDDFGANATVNAEGKLTEEVVYTVSELNGGDTIDGVLYDDAVFNVSVTLTDDGAGHIDARVNYPDSGIAFTNVYTGSDVTSQNISVGKTLVGRDMAAGEFSFELYTYDPTTGTMGNKVAGTTNDAAANGDRGNVAFGALSYTADMLGGEMSKTFYYAVTEVEGTDDNITYNQNGSVFYAGVTVTNDGQGNLSSTVAYYTDFTCTTPIEDAAQAPCFVNAYTPDPVTVGIDGFKTTSTVDAAPLPEGLTFGYEIVNVGDAAERYVGTSSANGKIDASITVDGAGTFTYRITEVNGGTTTGGITYDGSTYYLVLNVSTDTSTGAYVIDKRYYLGDPNNGGVPVDVMSFNNIYGDEVGTTLDLSATKTLSGATFEQLNPFGFTVTETTDGANNVVATGTTEGATGTTAEVDLSTIAYSFRVEQPVDEPVVSAVDPTVSEEQQPAEGEGTETEQPGEGIETGEPVQPTGGEGEAALPEQPVEGDVAEPSDDVAEAPVEGGETVEPVEPAQPEAPVEEAPVQPEVTDGTAQPEAPVEGDVEASSVVDLFVASEAIADDADAEVYTGAVVDEPAVVSEVEPVVEAPAPVAEPRVISSDLGLHTYVISENIPSGAVQNGDGTYTYRGVTYDTHNYVVTVDVQAPYDAATQTVTMTATVVSIDCYDAFGNVVPVTPAGIDGCDNVVFANSYYASTPVKLTGTDIQASKTLTGRDMADKEFSFTIAAAADNPDGTLAGATVASGTSAAARANEAAPISFGDLTFSKPGTYYFSLVENNAGANSNGVTYSTAVFEFSVTVTDNYDGTLSATVNYPEGGMAFTNEYKVNTSTSVTFEGTKTLTGRDMADKEFSFTVTELKADGTSELVAGGQSTAAGDREASAITFAPIKYTEPGEHDYVIAEVGAGTEKDGVTYDATVFNAHVSVTDNLDGTLSTSVTYSVGGEPCDAIAFENVYSNDGATATVTPEASKTLTGRDMKDGEFAFVVTDQATGKVVSNGTNTADGKVTFDAITLTAEGDYEFVISEVNGRQNGMTYDDTTFRMLVSATDDGKGGLTAEVSYPDGAPAFANSYKEPAKPAPVEPQVPKTGDETGLAGAAALGLGGLGVALIGGGALLRRRLNR